ncbi:MAG: hypothetical protein K6F90_02490 [Lachnospiraceae bacterium]|nr:hypothetical protein [Lachnospiraceae bacterium]
MATALAVILGGAIIYSTLKVDKSAETVEVQEYTAQSSENTKEVIELTLNTETKAEAATAKAEVKAGAGAEVPAAPAKTETQVTPAPAATPAVTPAAPAEVSVSGAPVSTSTVFTYEGPTELVSPKTDVHLVSADGTVDTWCSLRTDGDYYNKDSKRFKCGADGMFFDENGVQYVCTKVNVAE